MTDGQGFHNNAAAGAPPTQPTYAEAEDENAAVDVGKSLVIEYQADWDGNFDEKKISFGGVAPEVVRAKVNAYYDELVALRRANAGPPRAVPELLKEKMEKQASQGQAREEGDFEQAIRRMGQPYNHENLVPFFKKINQWSGAILRNAANDKIPLADFHLFGVDDNSEVSLFVSSSFDLHLRLSFDRLSRHQLVSEVARFVVPYMIISDERIKNDYKHQHQLTQMLLTVKGGVELAILFIKALEEDY